MKLFQSRLQEELAEAVVENVIIFKKAWFVFVYVKND